MLRMDHDQRGNNHADYSFTSNRTRSWSIKHCCFRDDILMRHVNLFNINVCEMTGSRSTRE